MENKIDWEQAYTFFISSEQHTLKETAEVFSIDYEYLRQRASDEKWILKKQEIASTARSLVEQQARDELVKRNTEMIQLCRAMQFKAAEVMAEGRVQLKAKDIRDWIATGIEIERRCLNMDERQPQLEEPKKVIITWGNGKPLNSYDEQRKANPY